MWPFKTRPQEEDFSWETWDVEDDPSIDPTFPSTAEPWEGYWEEDEQGEEPGVTVRALLITVVLILYAAYLGLGVFTTDYQDGRGYVVPVSLRAERTYIEQLTPFYEVTTRAVEAVGHLEANTTNSIDLQYQLQQLEETIRQLQLEEKGRTKIPAVYGAYQNYLLQLADAEVAYIQAKIAYHQDKNATRIPAMQESKAQLQYTIEQARSQMEEIKERLVRNMESKERRGSDNGPL